jgi:NADH:ubiquinone oxidoreductase subunit
MNSKMKSWTVSWLSHKTKVKPGLCGSRVMSGDWRRLHRVHRVSSGSTKEPSGFLVDPQSQDRRTEDGAAAVPDRSDQWVPV